VDYFLRFIAGKFLYFCIPFFVCVALVRFMVYRSAEWRYPMSDVLARSGFAARPIGAWIINVLHGLLLLLMLLFIAKPQLVDERSLLPVQGIDIVLVLDVSGSMQFVDDKDDQRSRFQVAKDEAIRLIEELLAP